MNTLNGESNIVLKNIYTDIELKKNEHYIVINKSAGVEKFEELYKVECPCGEFVGLFSNKDDAEIVAAMQPVDIDYGEGASVHSVKVYSDIYSWKEEQEKKSKANDRR
ncbi:MAG: hypothetical protein ACRC2R_09200 [Xenococcaceae cyanobacterium]